MPPSPIRSPVGESAPRQLRLRRLRRRRWCWQRGRRRRRKDGDVEFHAKLAVAAHRADEPPPARLVEAEAVVAGVPDGGDRCLVARLEVRPAHLRHVVGAGGVLERCKLKVSPDQRTRPIPEQLHDPKAGGLQS